MTLKTFSDKPKTFTFTYDFSDIDTAKVASNAIFGYMFGTYYIPVVETSIKNEGQLVVEYAEDRKLNKVFKKICDSFKDYYNTPEGSDTVENLYRLERVEQLKQSASLDSLIDKVIDYELELLDYAERLLSDNPILLTTETAHGSVELLGKLPLKTLKAVDRDNEYQGLWDYAYRG